MLVLVTFIQAGHYLTVKTLNLKTLSLNLYNMSYKFLIIGGLHGNEPLGINLVQAIQALKIPNIQAVYGNPEAVQKNVRFLNQDLNRVFPGKTDVDIEEKRAFELMQICQDYDFVLDFHNTYCPENDCGFVGEEKYLESIQLASFLVLDKVIVADYDCINKYAKNCLSVEISLTSEKNNIQYWVDRILNLAKFEIDQSLKVPDLFEFKRRVTRVEQNNFNFTSWKAFESISQKDAKILGLDSENQYFPIFVDDKYTSSYNFAGLVGRKYSF